MKPVYSSELSQQNWKVQMDQVVECQPVSSEMIIMICGHGVDLPTQIDVRLRRKTKMASQIRSGMGSCLSTYLWLEKIQSMATTYQSCELVKQFLKEQSPDTLKHFGSVMTDAVKRWYKPLIKKIQTLMPTLLCSLNKGEHCQLYTPLLDKRYIFYDQNVGSLGIFEIQKNGEALEIKEPNEMRMFLKSFPSYSPPLLEPNDFYYPSLVTDNFLLSDILDYYSLRYERILVVDTSCRSHIPGIRYPGIPIVTQHEYRPSFEEEMEEKGLVLQQEIQLLQEEGDQFPLYNNMFPSTIGEFEYVYRKCKIVFPEPEIQLKLDAVRESVYMRYARDRTDSETPINGTGNSTPITIDSNPILEYIRNIPHTIGELKQAYKEAVLRLHPDKGGDHEQFLKLQSEYEALKKRYHFYGRKTVRKNRLKNRRKTNM